MKLSTRSAALCAAMCLWAGHAAAVPSDFSFTGNLADGTAVQLFTFTVAAPSTVTLRTWSYAGGTNAAGQAIAGGGFDPFLWLFNGAGTLIQYNDDGPGVAADPVTHVAFDSLLTAMLAAGSYTVALTQSSTIAVGNLSDGFWGLYNWFPDITYSSGYRTSFWALDILNVGAAADGSSVPEPTPLTLVALALAGLSLARRGAGGPNPAAAAAA